MPTTLSRLLADIESKKVPPMILVGGNNDFLVEHAYQSIRDAILAGSPSVGVEAYGEVADLSSVIDSYRTFSLFASPRLLLVPEMNAFISKKELLSTYQKAVEDWKSAKTDRKRDSSLAKLLHTIGLVGLDVDSTDAEIAKILGVEPSPVLGDMLGLARATGKHATKGETDAALLAEAALHGGAPSTTLLMKTGAMPDQSATIGAIEKSGAVVVCDLSREQVPTVLQKALKEIEEESGAAFDANAVALLKQRLGVERLLADKYSKEIPDIGRFLAEAGCLATYAGEGKRVTAAMVEQQVTEIAGGARFEFASLVAEGKPVEAVAKLRDLVAQARREDPAIPADVVYGRFIFPLADEIRQLLAIQSFVRLRKLDPKRSIPYPMFKDSMADEIGAYLTGHGLVKQKPHPFPLHKRYDAARRYKEAGLLDALDRLSALEVSRKSGGTGAELGLELIVLGLNR